MYMMEQEGVVGILCLMGQEGVLGTLCLTSYTGWELDRLI